MKKIIQLRNDEFLNFKTIHGFSIRNHPKGYASKKSNIIKDWNIGIVKNYWSETELMGFNNTIPHRSFLVGFSGAFDLGNEVFQFNYAL